MAKATLTIEDLEEDGVVHVGLEFDPPMGKTGNATAAQQAAIRALQALRGEAEDEEVLEEHDHG